MQKTLFGAQAAPPPIEKNRVDFKPPKNIFLGAYYVSKTGQVIYTLHYVATKNKQGGIIVKLYIRMGREDPYQYVETDVDRFSLYISEGQLTLCA